MISQNQMEKLFAKIKKETLNPDEKAKIFSALRTFVIQNPIQSVKSPFYSEWFIFRQRMFAIPMAIILVFILTGGTVLAAKSSLPSSMLYPVKMLDEKVQSLTAVGPKAQAQVEISHAITRLQEAEQIISSGGQLSTTTRQQIQNNFETQTQNVVNHINELKKNGQTKDATKIQSDFEKSITEHQKAINEIFENKSEKSKHKND